MIIMNYRKRREESASGQRQFIAFVAEHHRRRERRHQFRAHGPFHHTSSAAGEMLHQLLHRPAGRRRLPGAQRPQRPHRSRHLPHAALAPPSSSAPSARLPVLALRTEVGLAPSTHRLFPSLQVPQQRTLKFSPQKHKKKKKKISFSFLL